MIANWPRNAAEGPRARGFCPALPRGELLRFNSNLARRATLNAVAEKSATEQRESELGPPGACLLARRSNGSLRVIPTWPFNL
jgi:hypothetical protein